MDLQLDKDCSIVEKELPSCLESLVSSCDQLRQLAGDIGKYHIKLLLAYGYAAESKVETLSEMLKYRRDGSNFKKPDLDSQTFVSFVNDSNILLAMNSTLKLLPYLRELSTFIEQCFTTIELTLRRCAYHLNLATNTTSSQQSYDQFRLPVETTNLHSVFICLMDLIYALVSLDQTIKCHTNLGSSLTMFSYTCKVVLDSSQQQIDLVDEHLASVPKDKLKKLMEHVSNLQATLVNEKLTIFQQCLRHLQHLELVLNSNSNLNKGYSNLCAHFEDFITFYHTDLLLEQDKQAIINLPHQKKLERVNLCLIQSQITPTLYMTKAPQKLFGLTSLFVLYSWLFDKTTKNSKIISSIMVQTIQHSRRISFIHLLGSNCYQMIDNFMSIHLTQQNQMVTKFCKQLQEQREHLLKIETKLEYDRLILKVTPWLIKFQGRKFVNIEEQDPKELVKLCNQGITLADEVNFLIKSVMTAHLHFSQPMGEKKLIPLLRLIALLKSIQNILSKDFIVHRFMLHSEKRVLSNWKNLMVSVRKRLVSLKYSERKLDILSVITITTICSTENLLAERGRQAMAFTLPMLVPLLKSEEIGYLNQLLSSFNSSCYIHNQISSSANCDYLFWQLPTFSTYYNHSLEEDPCAFDEIHYFLSALDDIIAVFKYQRKNQKPLDNIENLWLDEKVEKFCNNLEVELMEQFKVDFLDKICQEIEMELRLQTHRDLNLDGHNPFRRHLYNFKRIFSSPNSTFRMFNKYYLPLAQYVEQHLSRVCYNLTAIAPNDWFAYDQMSNLARNKYILQLANLQLPIQTLDYGMDLLDITRNLALFVSKFAYDLTNQVFIEKSASRLSATFLSSQNSVAAPSISGSISSFQNSASSNYASLNCQLNVVQVRHIAESIQTHGYGVVNSSVNCSYQLMKRLVTIFSKQMNDEKLRTFLTKEQLNLGRKQSGKSYSISFDKANQMAKCFRSGNSTLSEPSSGDNGTFDLDTVRQSITQLGNLLAFIRLLKSGALSCASKSVAYLPDLGDLHLLKLTTLAKSEFCDNNNDNNHNAECCQALLNASENFDQCLADIEENFSSRTNYFGIILDLFARLLKSPGSKHGAASKHGHLKLFYLAVPALTIHYVDYLSNCKDRIMSRSSQGRFGALISDDGFTMGLAFLLQSLGLTHQFNQLEWFKQVHWKLAEDRRAVEQRVVSKFPQNSMLLVGQRDESLKQTGQMTLRRLARLELEYESLNYTLNSALLFFRSTTLFCAPDVAPTWNGDSNPEEACGK